MARFIYVEVRDITELVGDTPVLSFDHVEVMGVNSEEDAYEQGPHQLDTQRDLANLTDDSDYGPFVSDYVVVLDV